MITDQQVALLRQRRMEGKNQETAGAMAGMSVRSARHWQSGPLPSETKTEHCRHAAVMASRLLRKANVETWIAEAQELKARRRDVTGERVIMVTLKGGWVQISDTDSLTTEQKSTISQIRQKKDGEIEVKFYDKQKALDALGKHLGLFVDRLQVEQVGVQPQINIVFGDAPRAAIVEAESRELPEGGTHE